MPHAAEHAERLGREVTEDQLHRVRLATERRRMEIARIVAAMPRSQRSGLVKALEAFAAAGEEPLAGNRPATEPGW